MLQLFEKYPSTLPDKLIRLVPPDTMAMFAPEHADRLVAHYCADRKILRIDQEVWDWLTEGERTRILKTKNSHTYVSQLLY